MLFLLEEVSHPAWHCVLSEDWVKNIFSGEGDVSDGERSSDEAGGG